MTTALHLVAQAVTDSFAIQMPVVHKQLKIWRLPLINLHKVTQISRSVFSSLLKALKHCEKYEGSKIGRLKPFLQTEEWLLINSNLSTGMFLWACAVDMFGMLLSAEQDSVTVSLECNWWKTGTKEALVLFFTV